MSDTRTNGAPTDDMRAHAGVTGPVRTAHAHSGDMPGSAMRQVPLYRLAHSRSGDKGDISNLSLIAWDAACYAVIESHVSAERVRDWFAYRQPCAVTRYLLPTLHAMNFVLEGVLDGGVNDALNLDAHGKSLSFHLLDMPVPVPTELAARLPDVPQDPLPWRAEDGAYAARVPDGR
jgi:hypothetical protein